MKPSKIKESQKSARTTIAKDRLWKLLGHVLRDNCSQDAWYDRVHGYIRARNPVLLYSWAAQPLGETEVCLTPDEFYRYEQVRAIVLKYPWHWEEIGLPKSPEDAAVEKYAASESACKRSNRRLCTSRVYKSRYAGMVSRMQDWILRVLGETPDLDEVLSSCSFSGGAAINVGGNSTSESRKLLTKVTLTPSLRWVVPKLLKHNEQWTLLIMTGEGAAIGSFDPAEAAVRLLAGSSQVAYNRLDFVPKSAKIHRPIAVEPLLNNYVQSGIDVVIRRRLASWGYDLTDQTRNQALARKGSVDGSLATMDLSAASDSLSIGVAKLLLPPAWFAFLDQARSPAFKYRNDVRRYEKFVSMGNGFCFPLETLFFAAAVRAALKEVSAPIKTHGVYGDDIIVPVEAFETLRKLLAFLGFSLNLEKSFASGPFRESCGADWYEGQDVRPVYLDYPLGDFGSLRIFHEASYRSPRTERFFWSARKFLREEVPKRLRYLRPLQRGVLVRNVHDRELEWWQIRNLCGAFSVPLDFFLAQGSGARWCCDESRFRWREVRYVPKEDHLEFNPESTWWHAVTFPSYTLKELKERARYIGFLRGTPGGKPSLRREARSAIVWI